MRGKRYAVYKAPPHSNGALSASRETNRCVQMDMRGPLAFMCWRGGQPLHSSTNLVLQKHLLQPTLGDKLSQSLHAVLNRPAMAAEAPMAEGGKWDCGCGGVQGHARWHPPPGLWGEGGGAADGGERAAAAAVNSHLEGASAAHRAQKTSAAPPCRRVALKSAFWSTVVKQSNQSTTTSPIR